MPKFTPSKDSNVAVQTQNLDFFKGRSESNDLIYGGLTVSHQSPLGSLHFIISQNDVGVQKKKILHVRPEQIRCYCLNSKSVTGQSRQDTIIFNICNVQHLLS